MELDAERENKKRNIIVCQARKKLAPMKHTLQRVYKLVSTLAQKVRSDLLTRLADRADLLYSATEWRGSTASPTEFAISGAALAERRNSGAGTERSCTQA
jgi:hypothetical protein